MFRRPFTAFLLLSASAPALAQTAPAQTPPPAARTGDHHNVWGEDIIVTALARAREDFLGGVSVLDGDALDAARRVSIGDTLAGLPGVSATSFGPGASRPVLRGFQGDRIRVLTDGIGSFDASSSSVDHAVAINPLLAERIEVLRGPAALLYGSSAIGGVVNMLDTRIPRAVPDEALHVELDADYGSAADERRGAGIADVSLGGGLVAHVDGSYARANDLRVGGFVLSRALREEAAESDDAEVAELAGLRGRLPNSGFETWEAGGGLALIREGGSLGVSVSRIESLYGVPNRYEIGHHDEDHGDHDHGHDHDHDHDEDHNHDHDDDHDHDHDHDHSDILIDMRQTRLDLRAEITPFAGPFERIGLRAGYADYRHDEIEGNGEIGTSFFNQGIEGRLEFVQRRMGAWGGAFGAQVFTRDYTVIGEEAFLPPTRTEQVGLFAVQNFDFGLVRVEGGARYERTGVAANPSDVIGTDADERRFNAISASLGGSIGLADGVRLGLNLAHTERAPSAEELYANGAHLATQAFEVGDRNLERERSNGAELVFRANRPGVTLEVSGYYNRFDNFIYLTPTGEEEDELPVFAYLSGEATQWGVEGALSATLFELGGGRVVGDVIGDYVRVTIEDDGPAPFIPPLRVLGGLEYRSPAFDVRGEVEHVTEQDRVAAFETATDAHTLVNARLTVRPFGADGPLSLRLMANNIFDVSARRHASFLKDYAPLAGRDIRVGASLSF